VKVLDFGIAKIIRGDIGGNAAPQLTATQSNGHSKPTIVAAPVEAKPAEAKAVEAKPEEKGGKKVSGKDDKKK